MMGNESSQLSGLEVDNKAIEVTDGWTLHSATSVSGNTLSVFISGLIRSDVAPILEYSSKNLMIYRHPRILKYVGSWKKNGKFHLATEEVTPLSQVLKNLTPLQICIGLHGILKALIFLHETALSSHNNVCSAAIYVTQDGTWKLGGLQHLCLFSKLSIKHMEQMKGRYEKAIPPESKAGKLNPTSIDSFGFGVLAEEVLRGQSDDCVPSLSEFKELCKVDLQNQDPALRPSLSRLSAHPFLSHDFIMIHGFLLELPLKSEAEKHSFFRSLSEELRRFPEDLVASQLGGLLLSRLVLLDATAQEFLLPHVMSPRNDEKNVGLFCVAIYREYLVPRLLQMMCVRDAQIRLLLLTHFPVLSSAFTKDQLCTLVLPELLVGIKDTNDHLVSVTLHVLADLVPTLGAATVIGGKRGKLFTDGRPNLGVSRQPRGPRKGVEAPERQVPASLENSSLPERPSPDGGEDHVLSASLSDEETEAWSDWENQVEVSPVQEKLDVNDMNSFSEAAVESSIVLPSHPNLPDISTLDIKHSAVIPSSKSKDEIDFFEDMVPVISKTHFTQVNEVANKGRFDITNEDEVEGWDFA